MTAKGKINASNVEVGMRIIIKASESGTVAESSTKTGEGVTVARVIGKTFRSAQGRYERRGKYVIETTEGNFEAAPIQTMFLAPEDAAGIKRAHAEALIEDKRINRAATPEEIAAPNEAEAMRVAVDAARNAETDEEAAEILSKVTGVPVSEETARTIADRKLIEDEYTEDDIRHIEAAIANATGAALDIMGQALVDAREYGKLSSESFRALNTRVVNRVAEFEMPEVGDRLQRFSDGNVYDVVEVHGDSIAIQTPTGFGWTAMTREDLFRVYRNFARNAWRDRTARCENNWHGSAPIREERLCPQCPL